jgi:hypothetical protein
MKNLGRIMLARRIMLGMVAGSAALLLGGCGQSENALRYKMTVEIDTPQGVKSGFAVREMTLNSDNLVGGPTGQVRGEAVVVDLPGGKTLFALMTGGDGDVDYAMQIGGRAQIWGKSPENPAAGPVELYPTAPGTTGLANTNPLPMLVTFRDIDDPASVERVEPGALYAKFGPGVKLKRITVATTNEAVTVGIEKRLRWLSHYPEPRLENIPPGGTSSPTFAQTVWHGAFRWGTK